MTYTHPKLPDDWNPDDWQGRKKEQVESSYQFGCIATIVLIITMILILLF